MHILLKFCGLRLEMSLTMLLFLILIPSFFSFTYPPTNPLTNAKRRTRMCMISGKKNLLLQESADDMSQVKYYSTKIDIFSAYQVLLDTSYIYNRALEDIEGDQTLLDAYISRISKKADDFMVGGVVWDRANLKTGLTAIVEKNNGGIFGCLLGG